MVYFKLVFFSVLYAFVLVLLTQQLTCFEELVQNAQEKVRPDGDAALTFANCSWFGADELKRTREQHRETSLTSGSDVTAEPSLRLKSWT